MGPWLLRALIAGALYTAIGVTFALPTNHVRAWRLAAWLVSAAVYAAHLVYEQIRKSYSVTSTALHTAVGASIGGLGLAIAAIIHSMVAPPNYHRSRFLLALVAWPAITGVPAFLFGLILSAALALAIKKLSS